MELAPFRFKFRSLLRKQSQPQLAALPYGTFRRQESAAELLRDGELLQHMVHWRADERIRQAELQPLSFASCRMDVPSVTFLCQDITASFYSMLCIQQMRSLIGMFVSFYRTAKGLFNIRAEKEQSTCGFLGKEVSCFVMKKVVLSVMLFFLAVIPLVALLPQAQSASQKACRAANIMLDKVYAVTDPLPETNYEGNGNVGYTGEGEGARRVPVLMYHYVIPEAYNREPGNRSIINLEAFEQGMEALHRAGYYTASLSELEDYVHGRIRLPEKTVMITFDDGYENNYIYAYPVLKKYGFRAAVFIIGGRVQEKTTEHFDPNISTYFSKEQMEASGDVFEFHSHTFDLHSKTVPQCGKQYASTRDIAKLKDDIAAMKRFGIDTPYFAYPYGDRNHAMVRQLAKDGYRMAFTVTQGFVEPGDAPMYLKRLTVTTDTDLLELLAE